MRHSPRSKLVTLGHALALAGTSYFLVATSAIPNEPIPPRECFENIVDGGTYEVVLADHLQGTTSISSVSGEGSGGTGPQLSGGGASNAGAGGAGGETGFTEDDELGVAPVPHDGCSGIDGLQTGGVLRVVLRDPYDSRAGCFSYEADVLDGVPERLNASFSSYSPADGSYSPADGKSLAREVASVTTAPGSGCEGTWTLDISASGSAELVDPTAPPSGTNFQVTRTIEFPQVQFCDGWIDPRARGAFSCTDTWSVDIREAP